MNRQELRNLVFGSIALVVLFLALELVGRVVAQAWQREDLYPDHHHDYTISGTVLDNAGNPLAGVVIYDGLGHYTLTDGNGIYALTNLPGGGYTIRAIKGGYVFSPAMRWVNLPPSTGGQDFVGIPKRPVIIVPGTGASANWPCFLFGVVCDDPDQWNFAPTVEGYYRALEDRLTAAGYTKWNNHLSYFFYDWRKPPAWNAAKLKAKIDQVKSLTGAPQVDLVAHSQGGLVSRAYIQGSDYGYDVAHLITLGTPHNGIPYLYALWEGGSTYSVGFMESVGLDIVLKNTAILFHEQARLAQFRIQAPSLKDMLPTFDYLYDEDHKDRLKPEIGMIHRNTYLPGLNDGLNTLFARTDVSTFAGTNVPTPLRFYVHDRRWWNPCEWPPKWDDGAPNWGREPQFRSLNGDNTVPTFSAELGAPAHVREFHGVKHGDLPNTPSVANAVLDTLGIQYAYRAQDGAEPQQAPEGLIVLLLHGAAQATVTDPLGRTVGPGGAFIPAAQYVSQPGELTKLVLIPAPAEGRFEIDVQGDGSGAYELSLLDTFTPRPEVVTDTLAFWDSPQSQIEPGAAVNFALDYTEGAGMTANLIAETPMIALPVWAAESTVAGRGQPGQALEIRDATNQALLGNGVVDAEGQFKIALAAKLQYGQRIYPRSGGVDGITVTVDRRATFLPVLYRRH